MVDAFLVEQAPPPPFTVTKEVQKMSVLDLTSLAILVVLTVLRLGVPLLGIWLLSTGLKRALPMQV